jgi:C-terminal processing protease CtpA/Prc
MCDLEIDAATRDSVIDGAIANLLEHYLSPVAAKKIAAVIRQRRDEGGYDSLSTARTLCDTLTAHLLEASGDRHIQLRYHVEPQSLAASHNRFDDPEFLEQLHWSMRLDNFGFTRVERLDGNVGYIDLRFCAPPEWDDCGAVAAATMTLIAQTSALIIDVRQNGGGAAGMVDLLCSYLLPATPERPIHLYDYYYRDGDRTEQHRTLSYVAGPRYLDRPAFVLTSGRSLSAAESLAYTLQTLGRATIIGETTGGAANPIGMYAIDAHFSITVTNRCYMHPATGTNWEGTGVIPDVVVSQEDAARVAHIAALKGIIEAADPALPDALADEMRATLIRLEGE